MYRGYVKIWRKMFDTSFSKDSYAIHLACHLILNANYKDKKIVFNGEEMVVKRGSFITGRDKIAMLTGINPSTVYRKLNLLKSIHFCDIKPNNKFSVITVNNYCTYQDSESINEQQKNNKRTTKEQPANTTNKEKKEKKEKGVLPPPQSYFYSSYKQVFKKDYFANFGKDGKIFKNLRAALPDERLKELIDTFFSSNDKFIKDSDYGIGVFQSQINKLNKDKIKRGRPDE